MPIQVVKCRTQTVFANQNNVFRKGTLFTLQIDTAKFLYGGVKVTDSVEDEQAHE